MQGRTKNGYLFGDLLGVGSFGKVYKATKQGKSYAIKKIIQNEENDSGAVEENFAHNYRIHSPFLVQSVDTFREEVDGEIFIYIVMEYCMGGNLSNVFNAQLDISRVMKIFIQGGLALYDLDLFDIIHRDIKPQNTLVDENDNLKICDFGCIRILSRTLTKTMAFKGTIPYMSPQVVQGLPYGRKTDVWSFGVVMYEVCTGRRPFTAPQELALILIIPVQPVPPIAPSALCPSELAEIIQSMLEKSEENRPSISTLMCHPFVVAYARRPEVDLYRFFPSSLKSLVEMKEAYDAVQRENARLREIEVSFLKLNGFTVTPTEEGPLCQFAGEGRCKTAYVNARIMEGIYRWTVRIRYGFDPEENECNSFLIGVDFSESPVHGYEDDFYNNPHFSFSKTWSVPISRSLSNNPPLLEDGTAPAETSVEADSEGVPDGSSVAIEVDTVKKTLSFFVNGVKRRGAILGIHVPLYLGILAYIGGRFKPSFTSLSFRRLLSPTPSAVVCHYYKTY